MMNVIDPSVVDEADPLQTDECLSAFNAANGFKTPPESLKLFAGLSVELPRRAARACRTDRCDRARPCSRASRSTGSG